jgi:hypothetical protein
MRRRQGPLQAIKGAANNASALMHAVREYGLDISLVSFQPPTVRVQVADGEVEASDETSVAGLIKSLFTFKENG